MGLGMSLVKVGKVLIASFSALVPVMDESSMVLDMVPDLLTGVCGHCTRFLLSSLQVEEKSYKFSWVWPGVEPMTSGSIVQHSNH